METVLVQIKNSKAYRLLEDLEELHIIKVLKKAVGPGQNFRKNMRANCLLRWLMNFKYRHQKAVANGTTGVFNGH